MLGDKDFARLVDQQDAAIFGVDDFLWYTLKPTPTSPLDFTAGDQLVAYAEANRQLVFGSHLVWDDGFGDGWTDDDLWGIDRATAETLLYGTVEGVVSHYRGRVAAWSCVNEAVGTITTEGDHGLRTDVPWYNTIGPDYVAESFRVAHAADPDAMLILNDF